LPPTAPLAAVVERIERLRPLARDARAVLTTTDRVGGPDELRTAVARLDALVAEVAG
jgi:hypothetical protein